MSDNRMEQISDLLLKEIESRFEKEPLNIDGLEFSESFAEMLDRFIVLHIRMWKLEDAIFDAKSDSEVAELKRKIDYCFKDRRPKLTKAINFFLDAYIDKNHHKKFVEPNIKFYNGFNEKETYPDGCFWPLMGNSIDDDDIFRMIEFIKSTKMFTSSVNVKKFEEEWNSWLGTKYSLFVSSGSTANLLLISAIKEKYKLKNGDKVLVPCCTWSTNISPIIQLGLEPVFCDINLKDFSFDIDFLKNNIKNKEEIKVVFVTHLLGIPADIHKYKEILPNAIFIEDSCESHGAEIYGKKVGTLSEGSTFSFYFGHHMTTIEGGMVSTDDLELYKLMKLKRSHGLARELPSEDFLIESEKYKEIDPKFLFLTDGFNFRNNEIGAVLGMSQLKKLDLNNNKRKYNFDKFISFMKQYENYFFIPKLEGNCSFCFPIICKEKSMKKPLEKEINKIGIATRPVVGGNLLRQPFLKKYKNEENYKNSDILNDNGFYIGNSHFVTEVHLSSLFNLISEFIDGEKNEV